MRILLFLFLLPIMVSCSGNTNPMKESNTNLTQGNVQLNLQVGKTSKAQVLEVFGAGWVHRSGSVCTPRWKTTSTRGVGGVGNDSICATRLFSTSSANPLRIAKVVRRSFSSAPSSAEGDESAWIVSMARRSTGNDVTRADEDAFCGCLA